MSGLNRPKQADAHDRLEWATALQRGNVRAVSRLLSLVENHNPEAIAALRSLNGSDRAALVIGVTGYPGAGKSTLVNQLVRIYRKQGKAVGIIAIDPSSPRTGGALLGDRIRMQDHVDDPGVFIRSMATRGHAGGMASTTGEAVTVLRAAGYDVIMIETVGVGQGEVEVEKVADLVVAVVAPGSGDDVQALKAGLLEVADLVVVNKNDREGADLTLKYLKEWVPCVLSTNAVTGEGVDRVAAFIAETARKKNSKFAAVEPSLRNR
jgi:LAO/AO transport system kinase